MTTTPPPPPYQPAPPYQSAPGGQPAPYAPQNWQPVAKRPPLTPRAKSGARWAGILSFNLISLGWFLFVVPVMLSLFAAFFTFLVGQMGRNQSTVDADYFRLKSFIDTVDLNAWVLPLILVAVVGALVWAFGIFISGRILKLRAVNHPWGVTWAAVGIAIVASWILEWIGGTFVQVASSVMGATHTPLLTSFIIVGILGLIIAIAINALAGWLVWWWMAHAMRSRQPIA